MIDLRARMSRKLAAVLGLALFAVVWEVMSHAAVGTLGLAAHLAAYLVVGILVIRFLNARHAMEQDISRHYELSLDLFCTATFDGYFDRLNPSWQRVLGWTEADQG